MEKQVNNQPDPSKIMQVGMGFWASKTLLVAVKFKLFDILSDGSKTARDIQEKLQLKTTERHVYDWLDALVSLGFLNREGLLGNATYSNSVETNLFLDTKKQTYIGGILQMANNRLYKHWGNLEEGLLTGEAQNESKGTENMEFFDTLYKSPEKLQQFMDAMSGIQLGNFMTLAKKFDFGKYSSVADIGGADGFLSCILANEYPNIKCTTFDLPPVGPLAEKRVSKFNLTDRVKVASGDFLKDPIPSADIIIMGNILHGLNEKTKVEVVKKVFDTLPSNGIFITIENIIDPERKNNTFGLLMSLNMLIENGDGFDYTQKDFEGWTKQAGFKKTEVIPLAGPTSAAIAYKN